MAQHDYNLSNATGANFRTDLNNMAQAIVTINSGTTEPAVRFPGMLWLDLSGGGDGIMRRRNQLNSGWLTDIGMDATARAAAAAAQTTANAALPRAGGNMTGAINLPGTEPTNNNALSRTWADTLYQVKLPVPVGGSLLVGTAGGWTATLAPGANSSVLTVNGGLPGWQATGVVASPGVLVRTGADGTIDASFIPQVASGLRFCGTFRPAVNAEYPTTGGHGAGGAPAIGDFWVIDGLTTGGYTYLNGPLAGVTVFNGDSIAYNGSGAWFRMGSQVNLQGYLKTDGTIAMAAALNMGGYAINNVGGIAGRTGSPVPLTNFVIDGTNSLISPQRTTATALPSLTAGQLATDIFTNQIVVGAGGGNTSLLPVRFHATTAGYVAGDYVRASNYLWRAPGSIAAGTFTAAQWNRVVDTGGATMTGMLYMDTGGTLRIKQGVALQFMKLDGSAPAAFAFTDTVNDEVRFFRNQNATEIALAIRHDSTYISRLVAEYAPTLWGNALVTNNGRLSVEAGILPQTNGASLIYPIRANANTGNDDNFECFVWRHVAGSGWTTANWRLRRRVDADQQGYIEFGNTTNNQAIGLATSAGMVIVIKYDKNVTMSGNLNVTGTVVASNIPGCDARFKQDIVRAKPRDLDALGFYGFRMADQQKTLKGCIAQDVEKYAAEHVHHFEESDPNRPGQTRDRMTVDYGALAYEMVCNLIGRVRELEGKDALPAAPDYSDLSPPPGEYSDGYQNETPSEPIFTDPPATPEPPTTGDDDNGKDATA